MKLNNKSKKIMFVMLAVVLIVVNAIFYLIASMSGIKEPSTIISWVFLNLGFVSFLVFSYLGSSKSGAARNVFLRFTLFGHCTIYLIVDFVLAIFFTILAANVEFSPVWTVIIQLVALGIHIFIALSCLMIKTVVDNLGAEVKQKTSRMKGFRVDAEMLVEYCTDAAAKEDFRKFAEAVRFSDPMSCDALNSAEDELEQIISEMKYHLRANEVEQAQNKCKIANNILKERNKKCLMFK